jgi:hypothetical protein
MFSLFVKRVKVTFINNVSGEIIAVSKMKPEQLPESFDKPTTMHLQEDEWTVAKADPVSRKQFAISGNLTLHLDPVDRFDPEKVLFTLPTISSELPGTVESRLFSDFILTLHEDDWRQNEFLPIGLLSTIQEEMASVEAILFPDEGSEETFGYKTIHVRSKIGARHLTIPMADFCELLAIREFCQERICGSLGEQCLLWHRGRGHYQRAVLASV